MLVHVENLVKRYGGLLALDHLNMDVKEGEIFGLLGPNGSGKTTAINCILSLLKYEQGSIQLFGKPMTPESYEIKKDIGVVMQEVAVFDELSVYQNIDYFCGLYIPDKGMRKSMVEEAIEFVGLESFVKFRPKKLSGGLLRRLNIACGIAHKPKLIFLDEPTVAVDPQSRNNILEGIVELNRQGATIIYTSHYMEEVEQICSQITILDNGKVIASGTKETLKDLISLGEKITVEAFQLEQASLSRLESLDHLLSWDYNDSHLFLRFEKGTGNLERVLDFMKGENIRYGRIHTEMPTLNDVFLEITGKQLRD